MAIKRDLEKPTRLADKKLKASFLSQDIQSTGDSKLRSLSDITAGIDGDDVAILSSSFILGTDDGGLVSTQQLNVDYSDFRNHTFFNSAVVNTNVAFNKVINVYPFDGTRGDVVGFLEKLTGFERYVFNKFPRSVGFLMFSGGLSSSITTKDFSDTKLVSIRDPGSGFNVVDPKNKSFTVEAQVFVPAEQTQGHQIIFQKLNGIQHGISLLLSQSTDTASGSMLFGISSGSNELYVTASFEKGKFNHIVATLDRETDTHKTQLFINRKLITEATGTNIGIISFSTTSLTIASGTAHFVSGVLMTPTLTFSGALDELRVWHATRSIDEQERFSTRNVFADKNKLRLYYRFNEQPNNTKPFLILDHSGFGLHGNLALSSSSGGTKRFDTSINGIHISASMRNTSSISATLTNEDTLFSPVLFSTHPDVITLNTDMLLSASNYDEQNQNLITRLIPQHYFEEGADFESQFADNDTHLDTLETFGKKLGSAQILASFLYTIAKGLDELKIFIDQFQNILTVNLDDFDTAPNALLDKVSEFYGLPFSTFFDDATFRQLFLSENITTDDAPLSINLIEIKDVLWKRIFSGLPDILKSKGTVHAIKSFIRAIGINPDTNFRIKEHGGTNISTISNARQIRLETSTLINLSSSTTTVGHLLSAPLSASRMVVNNYIPAGYLQVPMSFNAHDALRGGTHGGLLTSQSFAIEHIVKIPRTVTSNTQSLSRLAVTGSNVTLTDFVMNLIAFSSSLSVSSCSLKLFVKPFTSPETDQSDRMILTLSGVNMFDDEKWNVAYGRQALSHHSSSYFLYVGKANSNGEIDTLLTQSQNMKNTASAGFGTSVNVLSQLDSTFNASGSFLIFGSRSAGDDESTTKRLLISGSALGNDYEPATYVGFNGKVGHIKFWTKALSVKEFKEHTMNFKSIGTENPNNMSFNTASTERLIIDATSDQLTKNTNTSGELVVFDFSQNEMHLTGTGFNASDYIVHNEEFRYSILSPFFDENQINEKVNIRSFIQDDNVIRFGAKPAPVTEILVDEEVTYDPRFSIDFSIIEALDEDIIKIMATLDSFNNDIGDVQNMYSYEYKNLRELRRLYFNRLTDKVNLKSFFDFFTWFDQNIGDFIMKLIPARVNFNGINFVIESHMLERPKFNYHFYDTYINEIDRDFNSSDSKIIKNT